MLKKHILPVILLFVLLCLAISPASCADRSRYLDVALSFLEEDNPFLLRYNEQTGAGIKARFELGCPYFWGGRQAGAILRPASSSSSSDYYKTDRKYLCGFDCVGFTRYINLKTGYAEHPPVSGMLNRSLYTECIIRGAAKAHGEELSSLLRIGDILAIRHPSGGFHSAMYCGTLSYYGYTETTLPEELIPYINYPLLIHCTGSSDYHLRYKAWLEAQGMEDIEPPYGGVIVTILDVPPEAATASTPGAINLGAPCFDLEGYHLQVTDLAQEKQYRWIRWRGKPEE